jgi:adenylate cyclase
LAALRGQSRAWWVRRLRLGSGLALFSYVTTHFANHALGLVSLSAMEAGRDWFLSLWRSLPGTMLLYGALGVHLALALSSLYQRRHLRMPAWEAAQLIFGLAIPPLLTAHIVGTRLAYTWFDAIDSYARVVLNLWHLQPENGVRQSLVMVLAWLHGCIGLHFWLRLKPWYSRVVPLLFTTALLLPVLAWLGFVQAGREVTLRTQQPAWVQQLRRVTNAPDQEKRMALDHVREGILTGFGAALGGTLLARAARQWRQRRRGTVRITYADGRTVNVPPGLTILEASRLAGIPHSSVCGGRARCSTCRVRVTDGLEHLPPAGREERRVLSRVGAPPSVRLACQVRPVQDVTVLPLFPGNARVQDGFPAPAAFAGQEREIAVLFADLRGFTRIAEHKLPYDVVFFLNRYFETAGEAIKRAGGIVNQFTGDGVMALFGVEIGAAEGSRQALVAAGDLVRSLAAFSQAMADEVPAPLQIGIGIHTGPVVVGRMGYADTVYFTAVGDTVHVASRLEELTKEYGCQLVISEQVALRAGINVSRYPQHRVSLRNRAGALAVRVIDDARGLAAAVGGK